MESLHRFQNLGAAIMNTELVYAFLMGTGWFFLISWLVAIGIAYAKAFGGDPQWERMAVPKRISVRNRKS
jgi:hypothetical protein